MISNMSQEYLAARAAAAAVAVAQAGERLREASWNHGMCVAVVGHDGHNNHHLF